MKKFYISNNTENGYMHKETKLETIQFLLNFSKSFVITKAEGIQFESNLN